MLTTSLEGSFRRAAHDFQQNFQNAVDKEIGQSLIPSIVHPLCSPSGQNPHRFIVTVKYDKLDVEVKEEFAEESLSNLGDTWVEFRDRAIDSIIAKWKKKLEGGVE